MACLWSSGGAVELEDRLWITISFKQATHTHTHTFSMSNRSFWFKFNGTKHSCTSAVVCLRFLDKISRRKSNGGCVSAWQAGVAVSSSADVSNVHHVLLQMKWLCQCVSGFKFTRMQSENLWTISVDLSRSLTHTSPHLKMRQGCITRFKVM